MFSVVIPTYNEEKYISKLLDSLKKQTLQPKEVIVADTSNDRTPEIAKSYGCKVIEGGRIAVGRNNGAKIATQEIIVFLDADVVIPSKKFFNKIVGKFISGGADVASCLFMPSDRKVKYSIPMAGLSAFRFVTHKLKKDVLHGGACIVTTKQAFKELNGFNEEMKAHEDSDYFKRAVKAGLKFIVIPQFIEVSTRRYEKKKMRNVFLLGALGIIVGLVGGGWLKSKMKKKDEQFWDDVK